MSSDCQHTPSPPQPAARPLEEEEDTATMSVKKGEGVNCIPRYLMAALVMMESSRLEVPPKLLTTRATSIPAVGKMDNKHCLVTQAHKQHQYNIPGSILKY